MAKATTQKQDKCSEFSSDWMMEPLMASSESSARVSNTNVVGTTGGPLILVAAPHQATRDINNNNNRNPASHVSSAKTLDAAEVETAPSVDDSSSAVISPDLLRQRKELAHAGGGTRKAGNSEDDSLLALRLDVADRILLVQWVCPVLLPLIYLMTQGGIPQGFYFLATAVNGFLWLHSYYWWRALDSVDCIPTAVWATIWISGGDDTLGIPLLLFLFCHLLIQSRQRITALLRETAERDNGGGSSTEQETPTKLTSSSSNRAPATTRRTLSTLLALLQSAAKTIFQWTWPILILFPIVSASSWTGITAYVVTPAILVVVSWFEARNHQQQNGKTDSCADNNKEENEKDGDDGDSSGDDALNQLDVGVKLYFPPLFWLVALPLILGSVGWVIPFEACLCGVLALVLVCAVWLVRLATSASRQEEMTANYALTLLNDQLSKVLLQPLEKQFVQEQQQQEQADSNTSEEGAEMMKPKRAHHDTTSLPPHRNRTAANKDKDPFLLFLVMVGLCLWNTLFLMIAHAKLSQQENLSFVSPHSGGNSERLWYLQEH